MSASIGVFFASTSGSTEDAADRIKEVLAHLPGMPTWAVISLNLRCSCQAFGDDAAGPINIDDVEEDLAAAFSKYDCLVVGAPTYNTGADKERTGTTWDEIYYGTHGCFAPSEAGII